MQPIIFTLFDNTTFADTLARDLNCVKGECVLREFPDGETYLQIVSNVQHKPIVLIASLDYPNPKLLPLILMAATLKDLGASSIGLVAPYLPYMRQDKRFNSGEGVTSAYFGALLSKYFNWLITFEPHLHRRRSMDEIYSIPSEVLLTTDPIVAWIKSNIKKPLLVGPDRESVHQIMPIADKLAAPYIICEKKRKGDREVEVSLPDITPYKDYTPVLVDDIISTGKTMIAVVKKLQLEKMPAPICIGVHGVFVNNAYAELQQSGAARIITCNTIVHASNAIDVSGMASSAITRFLR